MPKLKAVDPDDFNPFTPIPFHNNPENRYRFANMKMHNYLNPYTQINQKDFFFKNFHFSYDHDNEKQYVYQYVSMHPSDHVAHKPHAHVHHAWTTINIFYIYKYSFYLNFTNT